MLAAVPPHARAGSLALTIERVVGPVVGGRAATIELSVPEAARRGGEIFLEIVTDGLVFRAARLDWLAESAAGGMHLRGRGRLANERRDSEFRADVMTDGPVGSLAADARVIVRIYGAGADPEIASPEVKFEILLPSCAVSASTSAAGFGNE